MNLGYKEDYWDSPELKQKFNAYLIEIFGLDLSPWDIAGFWDNNYRPFSYFDGDKLASNVCLYSMNMTVNGKQCRVAQMSAVGTRPEYRRRGLSLDLSQKAMEWARTNHDFFYLFADTEALGLYKKLGFRKVVEHKARISVDGKTPRPGIVKLDVKRKDHLEQIYKFACERTPVSDLLGVSNEKLFMFWCICYLQDHIYFIPELDILVLYKRENGLITVYDIVGKNIPAFDDIHPFISNKSDKVTEFLFMVDKLDLRSCEIVQADDNGTHIFGHFPIEDKQFIFPFTAQA